MQFHPNVIQFLLESLLVFQRFLEYIHRIDEKMFNSKANLYYQLHVKLTLKILTKCFSKKLAMNQNIISMQSMCINIFDEIY